MKEVYPQSVTTEGRGGTEGFVALIKSCRVRTEETDLRPVTEYTTEKRLGNLN